jgi:hypothetical protein
MHPRIMAPQQGAQHASIVGIDDANGAPACGMEEEAKDVHSSPAGKSLPVLEELPDAGEDEDDEQNDDENGEKGPGEGSLSSPGNSPSRRNASGRLSHMLGLGRSSGRLRDGDDSQQIRARVSMPPAYQPARVGVRLDSSKQHTITWEAPLTSADRVVLPAGKICLYLYPTVTLAASGQSLSASGDALAALEELILAACASGRGFELATDEVGAYVQHAIVVANTSEALRLAERLFCAQPALLRQVHGKHRTLRIPLFTGESALHILAVNRRGRLLAELIKLAAQALRQDEARTLFTTQASGVFFLDDPMRYYGGTPLAFAAAFELREAIHAYLTTGLIGLNDRAHACALTGFLPIHTAVAHGHCELYDWMTGGVDLARSLRADPTAESAVGRLTALDLHGLTPLGLATQLGDHDVVRHLLRKQTTTLWVWGPITQHSIDLRGIDSVGDGGSDMLELVARLGASRGTQVRGAAAMPPATPNPT